MPVFSLLALVVVPVLVGVGIVLGAVAVVLTFALVAAGVVSSSVMIGVWRGQAQAGLRAFLLQLGALGGVVVALMLDFVAGRVRRWLGAPLEGAKRRELPHV